MCESTKEIKFTKAYDTAGSTTKITGDASKMETFYSQIHVSIFLFLMSVLQHSLAPEARNAQLFTKDQSASERGWSARGDGEDELRDNQTGKTMIKLLRRRWSWPQAGLETLEELDEKWDAYMEAGDGDVVRRSQRCSLPPAACKWSPDVGEVARALRHAYSCCTTHAGTQTHVVNVTRSGGHSRA